MCDGRRMRKITFLECGNSLSKNLLVIVHACVERCTCISSLLCLHENFLNIVVNALSFSFSLYLFIYFHPVMAIHSIH